MNINAVRKVLEHSAHKGSAKVLLALLAWESNSEGWADNLTKRYIASKVCVSPRQARKLTQKLVETDEIEIARFTYDGKECVSYRIAECYRDDPEEIEDEPEDPIARMEAEIETLRERVRYLSSRHDSNRAPTPAMRVRVVERDGAVCRYCDQPVDISDIHIDHVYPYSKGGVTVEENLVVACPDCNTKKGNKIGIWPLTKEADWDSSVYTLQPWGDPPEDFFYVPQEVMDANLDPYQFRVLAHWFRTGNPDESIRNLAGNCNISPGKASTVRRELEAMGWAEWFKKRGEE